MLFLLSTFPAKNDWNFSFKIQIHIKNVKTFKTQSEVKWVHIFRKFFDWMCWDKSWSSRYRIYANFSARLMQSLIQSTKSITAQCILCTASFINSNRYVLNKLLNLIVLRKSRNFSQISFRSEESSQSQLKVQELSAETFLLKCACLSKSFFRSACTFKSELGHEKLQFGLFHLWSYLIEWFLIWFLWQIPQALRWVWHDNQKRISFILQSKF